MYYWLEPFRLRPMLLGRAGGGSLSATRDLRQTGGNNNGKSKINSNS